MLVFRNTILDEVPTTCNESFRELSSQRELPGEQQGHSHEACGACAGAGAAGDV